MVDHPVITGSPQNKHHIDLNISTIEQSFCTQLPILPTGDGGRTSAGTGHRFDLSHAAVGGLVGLFHVSDGASRATSGITALQDGPVPLQEARLVHLPALREGVRPLHTGIVITAAGQCIGHAYATAHAVVTNATA